MTETNAKNSKTILNNIQHTLFSMKDEKYKAFNAKLIPTVKPDLIIGVRTPELRKYAKALAKTPESESFISILPHKYYEENNLHAFIIELLKDYDKALLETERFLPYIDNWATCDMFLPKVFSKNTGSLLVKIQEWLKSDRVYTVRYAIGLLMSLYLDENFNSDFLQDVASVHSDEYYINMMISWYFATALAKQYDCTVTYITEKKLDKWVHNKTIQKAVESNRISDDIKKYLKTLKIK